MLFAFVYSLLRLLLDVADVLKGGKRVSNSGRSRIDVAETAQDGTGGDVSLACPQVGGHAAPIESWATT